MTRSETEQGARPLVIVIGPRACASILRTRGFATRVHTTLAKGKPGFTAHDARAIVIDWSVAPEDELIGRIADLRRTAPLVDVVVWAQRAGANVVRRALLAGAKDVVLGGPKRLAEKVADVVAGQQFLPRLERLDARGRRRSRFEGLASRSAAMWDIFDLCVRVAPTEATVLISGETGTGKELVARAVHRRSGRRGRFVALNCAAVPESLIDAELFGHEKGTFTGATSHKRGLFRHADGGTLLLDEIGNIPLPVQFRLLRVLQEGAIRPVGGYDEIRIDVRIVAATSAPLLSAVERGEFREDLYYRLDVIRVNVPPLRSRPEDVLFLFGHFTSRFAKSYGVERPRFSEGFLEALLEFRWPGNVRQLENFTERLTLTYPGQRLTRKQFTRLAGTAASKASADTMQTASEEATSPPRVDLKRNLRETVDDLVRDTERRFLEQALTATRGRVQAAADIAGINRRTLLRKLKRHGIDKRWYKPG
ncbi:sigma-54 interaction domain-containing protein [Planctomycetota bacterium]